MMQPENPTWGDRGRYAAWRMATPGGFATAGQEMVNRTSDYVGRFGSQELAPGYIEGLRGGMGLPGDRSVPGTKFAGGKMADSLESVGALRRAVNMVPGLNLIGDIFDVGAAMVGVARKDGKRQGQTRELAQQMAQSGVSLDDAMSYINSGQGGSQLRNLAGSQTAGDFGKTVAYGAFTGLPSLNPIAAVAGLVEAGDLQWEKHRRNQIFKDEFAKAQGGSWA